MRITEVNNGEGFLDREILDRLKREIYTSLNQVVANSTTQFIVNPTCWYNINPTKRGVNEAKPKVVNSADYISDHFLRNLSRFGWVSGDRERTIDGQTIDGYIELTPNAEMYRISEERFFEFFTHLPLEQRQRFSNIRTAFNFYYSRYCNSGWEIPRELEHLLHHFQVCEQRVIKIGLEFETGNIASSFRALSKLDNLFHSGDIDFGVFITSLDKNSTAAKIWPISNRNGSFEELNNRNYKAGLTIPLLEIGFQPDGFDNNGSYLGSSGEQFVPEVTNEIVSIGNERYQKYLYRNNPYWKKL